MRAAAIKRLDHLREVSRILASAIENAPEGTLRVRNIRGVPYLYVYNGKKESYISMTDAGELATKRYHVYAAGLVEQEISAIEKYLEKMPEIRFEEAFARIPEQIKPIVKPAVMTDEEYARRWQAERFIPKRFDLLDDSQFYTKRGERVRSKSEVIIANALNDLGIPYKYECPLVLDGGMTVIYPDFTILKVRSREEYYLEHAGMMEDPAYCRRLVARIRQYQGNGIYFGDRLLFTCETKQIPLSTRDLDGFLRHFFL